ncbi:MAG: hypothetical protein IPN85_13360 [Flavobacteriales bacterium]|nr:hypothetical protein [Flavobacteriales bacterium]
MTLIVLGSSHAYRGYASARLRRPRIAHVQPVPARRPRWNTYRLLKEYAVTAANCGCAAHRIFAEGASINEGLGSTSELVMKYDFGAGGHWSMAGWTRHDSRV